MTNANNHQTRAAATAWFSLPLAKQLTSSNPSLSVNGSSCNWLVERLRKGHSSSGTSELWDFQQVLTNRDHPAPQLPVAMLSGLAHQEDPVPWQPLLPPSVQMTEP